MSLSGATMTSIVEIKKLIQKSNFYKLLSIDYWTEYNGFIITWMLHQISMCSNKVTHSRLK